jgi:HPt (histidine-containing phosphotransfer) domain-containing protein/signal transduction histidine kinase
MTGILRNRQNGHTLTVTGCGAPLRDEHSAIRSGVIVFHEMQRSVAGADGTGATPDQSLRLPALNFDLLSYLQPEIKQNLVAIDASASKLLESGLSEQQRADVLAIEAHNTLLMRASDEVLEYSHLAGGDVVFESGVFDLRDVVTAAVEAMAQNALRNGSTLALSTLRISGKLCGDGKRLTQMLTGFIGAAIELARPGEIGIRVAPSAPDNSNSKLQYRFTIDLPGADLAAETRDRFLIPAAGVKTMEPRAYQVSGLTLTLAARIAMAMGGKVEIEDTSAGPALSATIGFEQARFGRGMTLESPSLDEAVLADIRGLHDSADGSAGVFQDLVTVFLRYLPGRLQNLENAIGDNDAPVLARQTHALRGACAGMGAARMALLCAEIESSATRDDIDAAREIMPELHYEADRVSTLLQGECDRLPAEGSAPQTI